MHIKNDVVRLISKISHPVYYTSHLFKTHRPSTCYVRNYHLSFRRGREERVPGGIFLVAL